MSSYQKIVSCINCGEQGHVIKYCKGPVTSFGIIAFTHVNVPLDTSLLSLLPIHLQKDDDPLKFLMIQRRDTMAYIDFIRGKYEHVDALPVLFQEMTPEEKHKLRTKSFDELWNSIWLNKNSRIFKRDHTESKEKYEANSQLRIKLLATSPTYYSFPEFGFPKGRKNINEHNIACAEREFEEETNYKRRHYTYVNNYPPIVEQFQGTNGIAYKHVYYLARMNSGILHPPLLDSTNLIQMEEVKNIGWFTYNQCLYLFRPYDTAKRDMLQRVYKDIKSNYNAFSYKMLPIRKKNTSRIKSI